MQYEGIFIHPAKGGSLPLIVWPHGGPHSVFLTNWHMATAFFAQLGYAVLRSKCMRCFTLNSF